MEKMTVKEKIYHVIYGTDTPAGRGFDLALLWLILASIVVVCLESVPAYNAGYLRYFIALEWTFTAIFSLEYLLRIYSHPRPLRYFTSFYGIIDLISILPTYLTFFVPGLQYLMSVRILRLLRIFRILKLTSFIRNAQIIQSALINSIHKLTVFIAAVLCLVLIIGTLIYVIEGPENGFTSIPLSIYWTIVTITTVGYGDITPKTSLGQILSSVVMLIGYALIAVPTGIVSAELSKSPDYHGEPDGAAQLPCPNCQSILPAKDSYCRHCGHNLKPV